jgi:glucan biosynthesis protein C
LLLGIAYAAVRRTLFIVYPPILSDGLFNFVVMQSLFYIPFFMIGALAFIYPKLKALFTTPSPWCALARQSRLRLSAEPALRQRRCLDV